MVREAVMPSPKIARFSVSSFIAAALARGGDWLVLIALALLWQLFVSLHVIRNGAFPAPTLILASLVHDVFANGHPLVGAAVHTLALTVAGYVASVVFGIPIGFAMGRNPDIRAAINPLVALTLPLPAVVTIPVLTLWIRDTSTIVIAVVAFATCPPLIKAAELGARSVGRIHWWAAASLGASRLRVLLQVVLPGSLVHVLPAMRVAMGYSWRAVVAAEFITLIKPGLGTTIFSARQFDDVPLMYAGLILIGVLGYFLERGVIGSIERATLRRWGLLAR